MRDTHGCRPNSVLEIVQFVHVSRLKHVKRPNCSRCLRRSRLRTVRQLTPVRNGSDAAGGSACPRLGQREHEGSDRSSKASEMRRVCYDRVRGLESRCFHRFHAPCRSRRVSGFSYAIRNIVAEAKKVEAAGAPVRYLNIGDPIPFGFADAAAPRRGRGARDARRTQRLHAVARAFSTAREAVAEDFTARGFPVDGRSRPAHVRHLGRHRAHARRARRRRTTRCWCRCRRTRCTRRCWRSSARARSTTGPIRREAGSRTSTTCASLDHAADARARADRSEQSDRRRLSARRRSSR